MLYASLNIQNNIPVLLCLVSSQGWSEKGGGGKRGVKLNNHINKEVLSILQLCPYKIKPDLT
jgi:hypothetical protein